MFSLSCSAILLLSVASSHAKLLTIVSFEHKPFLEHVDGYGVSGFIPDLLDAIAREEPFSYKLVTPADGKYGAFVDGKWNGMMGMVVNKEADLVAADLTTTVKRMEDVDFSLPFLTTSVTILMKSSGMSWHLHRGSHGLTATPALAANPTTVEQILNVTDTRFGVVVGGSSEAMLRRTQLPSHQAIYASIVQNQDNNGIVSNAMGVEKVKSETGYGFLMEKMSAEYHVGRDETCSLYTVGNLAQANYGFGFPKGSALREMFSRGILKVSTNGSLYSLIKKWFPENQNCFSSRISASIGSP